MLSGCKRFFQASVSSADLSVLCGESLPLRYNKNRSATRTPMLRAATLLCISLLFTTFLSAQTPQRPKIYGIAYVRIKSSDFQKASETYSKILGLSPSGDSCTGVKILASPLTATSTSN
jgi:hypothetical protein